MSGFFYPPRKTVPSIVVYICSEIHLQMMGNNQLHFDMDFENMDRVGSAQEKKIIVIINPKCWKTFLKFLEICQINEQIIYTLFWLSNSSCSSVILNYICENVLKFKICCLVYLAISSLESINTFTEVVVIISINKTSCIVHAWIWTARICGRNNRDDRTWINWTWINRTWSNWDWSSRYLK